MGLIYKITNKLNNKSYIGQTHKSLEIRWKRHCWQSEYKKNMPICLAIKKYGKENFSVEEITQCSSQKELDEKEIFYVNIFNTFSPHGYNLKAGQARGICSEETKKKISESNKGKKVTDETKRKLSDSHKGYKVKQETKEKLSKINKGKIPPKHVAEAAIKHHQKDYIITFPDGLKIEITNMKLFCKNNNLSESSMCLVAKGKQNNHKGFKVKYKGVE